MQHKDTFTSNEAVTFMVQILLKQEQSFRKDMGWLCQAEKQGKPVMWIARPLFSLAPSLRPGVPLEQAIVVPHLLCTKTVLKTQW